jgi:hypothetical protein
MSTFIISYDLNNAKNYDKLHKAINAFHNVCPVLKSAWMIETQVTSLSIATYLNSFIDDDDEILVSEIVDGSTAFKVNDANAYNWLETNG